MKTYTILAESVTGNGSLVFNKGQVVPMNRLRQAHIMDLLSQGAIEETKAATVIKQDQSPVKTDTKA